MIDTTFLHFTHRMSLAIPTAAIALFVGCSSSSGADAGADAGPAVASCTAPGMPTSGPADMHCALPDGGTMVQPTSQAACTVLPDGGGDDGGAPTCAYGDTMYGTESDDDDCKYHVKWTHGDLCEGAGGVSFTVTATNKTDNTPAAGATPYAEAFTTSPPEAGCDDQSPHASPNDGVMLHEGPAGTYTGRIVFDTPGQWTVRFHFYPACFDTLATSRHGHAAYHLTIP